MTPTLLLLLATITGACAAPLAFTLRNQHPGFSPRHDASLKQFDYVAYTDMSGNSMSATNALVFFSGRFSQAAGSSSNDVWLSGNGGYGNWTLISGVTSAGVSAFNSGTSWSPAQIMMSEVQDFLGNQLFLLGGCDSQDGSGTHGTTYTVWQSVNGAVSWQRIDTRPGATHFTPRCAGNSVMDSAGVIYLMAGFKEDSGYLNDVWTSTNGGLTWAARQYNTAIWTPRATGVTFIVSSGVLGRDILYMMAGHDDIGFKNDIWASSNGGTGWSLVTAQAAWPAREAPGVEVTAEGMIILVAGLNNDFEGGMNDVFVSMDGGYTWGNCQKEAAFPDMWWPATMLDTNGYLYVAAGYTSQGNINTDALYVSNGTFRDIQNIEMECNTRAPRVRGLGLQCWPPQSRCDNPLYTAAARNTWNFDIQPNPAVPMVGSNYTWVAYDEGHWGIASFNGVNQFVNLLSYPDQNGQYFPRTMGGSCSFEIWAQFKSFNQWSRLFDSGTGALQGNLVISNVEGSRSLGLHVYNEAFGFGFHSELTVVDLFRANQWFHLICSIGQRDPNDISSATSAQYACFLNGNQIMGVLGVVVPAIQRADAWLAKSSWANDGYFNGWIDSFHWFDYAVSQEQAQVHYILQKRLPIFELTFDRDIRPWLGTERTATYGWQSVDETDYNGTISNQGVLTFNGVNQYVNLNNANGSDSIGTVMPRFGANYSSGSWSPWWAPNQMSFEILFKTPDQQIYTRIFDFGAGQQVYNVELLMLENTTTLWFATINADYGTDNNRFATGLVVVDNLILGQWYHVVITLQRGNDDRSTTMSVYSNGVLINSRNDAYWPKDVNRFNAFLGRSGWIDYNDQYFNGSIDALRVYDYALDDELVARLYSLVKIRDLYSTGPVSTYRFDENPQSFIGGSTYGWKSVSGSHNGVATFNGNNQFINLLATPDSQGSIFPQRIGGSMSFELWAKMDQPNGFARLFDIGNGAAVDNILLAQRGDVSDIILDIYVNGAQSQIDIINGFSFGNWQHIVCSISQLNPDDTSSAQAALYQCFVNGQIVGARLGALPPTIPRLSSYIGRSNWPSDGYLIGEIDAFYYYNYGLTSEQAQIHYALPKPPAFELGFSVDPRTAAVQAPYNMFRYGWVATIDAGTFNNTVLNAGLITLNGVNQYINLAASTGPYSVGTTLPTIGGRLTSRGQVTDGWSIECYFRTPDAQRYGRVYDLGVGVDADNIILMFLGDTNQIIYRQYNANVTKHGYTDLAVISNTVLGKWYHVVLTVALGATESTSTATSYVDGVRVASNSYAYNIRGVARPNAFLGRSNWVSDEYFAGEYDSFRVYDYVLQADVIQALNRISQGVPGTGGGGDNPPTGNDSSSVATVLIVVFVLLGVAALSGGGYYYYRNYYSQGRSFSSSFGQNILGSRGNIQDKLLDTEMSDENSGYRPPRG